MQITTLLLFSSLLFSSHFKVKILSYIFIIATLAVTASATVSASAPFRATDCFENLTTDLHCYTGFDDVPQNITEADVTYIAKYLYAYGRQTKEGRLFTMTAQDAPNYDKWTVYARKSSLALAKHIDSSKNSSVLFKDIATAIDGGEKATTDDKKNAIVRCLTAGGSIGVKANLAKPVYTSDNYKKGYFSPEGILINIVSNTQ